jgi:hypothetical protein
MPYSPQTPPTVVSFADLSESELAPTPAQTAAIAAGCVANALKGLTPDQRQGLMSAVSAVEADLSAAIDTLHQRGSRMTIQSENLRNEISKIQGGQSSIGNLYVYAAPAIASCPTAANAALQAKQGSDIVHARMNELQYQQTLIAETSVLLASEEQELSDAMNALDGLVLSLGQ